MPKPYISVIMTAYNRKQFLNGAVDSVLIQTLDRSLYEIIIMKNFKTDYDKGWKKEGIKLLYKPDGSSGEFLYEAVKAAKGEVIAFLEDDDQFERGKLSAVYESFTKNPYLVYYYNSRKYIDAHGNDAENVNLPSNALRTKDRFIGKMDRSGMFRLLLLSSFNMSSMAIKKPILADNLKWLKKIPEMQDTFTVCAVMGSGGQALCSSKVLTKYRIHGASTSSFKTVEKMNEQITRYTTLSYPQMKEMLNNSKNPSALRALDAMIYRMLVDNKILNGNRIGILSTLKYLLDYSLPMLFYCSKFDRFAVLVLLSLVFPKRAQKILAGRELAT